MDGSQFLAIVNKYGEENIIGIGYDNSAGNTFPHEGMFTLANNYLPDIECLKFTEFDTKGYPFHTIKHVENIQSIIVKDRNVPREKYDYVHIRG